MLQKSTPISMDDDTRALLDEIAEQRAEGDKPNRSKEVRRLVRKEAAELGLIQKENRASKVKVSIGH